jgi:methionyl-tRNA formyltransferase
MRIVFMGTADFAVPVLAALADSSYDVAAVYTQPDRPAGRGRAPAPPSVKRFAVLRGLEVRQPERLRGEQELQALAALRPEVIVVAAYGQILRPAVLEIPRHGCLNVHASLLPRHRGPSPLAAAILSGDEETGVSIMLLDPGMDTGPVLAQERVPILPEDTTGSLLVKLADLGTRLLLDVLPRWVAGEIVPQPQDETKATYSRIVTKDEGELDWSRPAVELWRRVRAFQPWPGAYTFWNGKLLKVLQAVPMPDLDAEPGEVRTVKSQPAQLAVQTAAGSLGLVEVQIEGKRALSAEEFARGARGFVGSRLGQR